MPRYSLKKWESKRALIEKLIFDEKLTDGEIAERLGISSDLFAYHRKQMGIEQPQKRRYVAVVVPQFAPEQVTTYIENGITVTVCPPRYARGIGLYNFTARPKK